MALTMLVSCEKYDNYDASELPIVGFTRANLNINNIPAGGEKASEVNVFSSTAANVDRTFNIVLIPNADPIGNPPADPENYEFDSTVTIPANERIGVVNILGKNISLPEDRTFFTLSVESGSDVIAGGVVTVGLK